MYSYISTTCRVIIIVLLLFFVQKELEKLEEDDQDHDGMIQKTSILIINIRSYKFNYFFNFQIFSLIFIDFSYTTFDQTSRICHTGMCSV